MILAIDTSAAQCAAALVLGERVHSRSEPMERGHAERLMPMIAELMAEADASWDDLAAVAVCTGPGSFTGIRVGVAAARGIALGRGIPTVGVSRLEAIAATGDPGQAVAVVLAGRGGEVIMQLFGEAGSAAAEPMFIPREQLSAALPPSVPHLGDAVEGASARDGLADPVVIARIARLRLADQTIPRPAPIYLRPPNAAPSSDLPPVLLP